MVPINDEYLSPRQLASALGLSESTLKRWIDRGHITVHKTLGGHRRIALPDAVAFIRKEGMPILDSGVLGLPENATSPMVQGGHDDLQEAMQLSLIHI